jgi:hypothetical protein
MHAAWCHQGTGSCSEDQAAQFGFLVLVRFSVVSPVELPYIHRCLLLPADAVFSSSAASSQCVKLMQQYCPPVNLHKWSQPYKGHMLITHNRPSTVPETAVLLRTRWDKCPFQISVQLSPTRECSPLRFFNSKLKVYIVLAARK